ncbi:MAG: choice-of-anchor D domain-containing protein [Betaproteobacteria bacterium]|nr:choice-of-anchor D domain-containing protein [Betaproteobacteria bacterium]
MGQRPANTSNRVISACLLAIGLAGAPAGQALAQLLPLPVFNTGVDKAGAPMPGESIDGHYTLVSSADPDFPGPRAFVTARIAEGLWLPNDDKSKWISPSPMQESPNPAHCNPEGAYTYRTTFNLTGFDVATASIKGNWAADSAGSALLLNGVVTGHTTSSYDKFASFDLTSGFNSGVNTLDFVVIDSACPTGLRVEMSGTALATDVVPDPFAFPSRTDVSPLTTQTSDPVTPVGYAAPAAITIANGEYSIGCTPSATAAPGTISPGQSVCVRHNASVGFNSPVTTTLTIGGVAGTFTTTTTGGPVLSLSPALVSFVGQTIGTTSGGQVVTFSNTGGFSGGFFSPTVTGDFAIVASNCATPLAANSSCSITVTFSPLGAGLLNGTLQIVSAAGTISVALSGTGLTPNPADIVAIAVGYSHTCALTTVGGVKCWGSNGLGQLGDNQISGNQSLVPVDVPGLASGVTAIAAGLEHMCAIAAGGAVKCWGKNSGGQLGDNSRTQRTAPVGVVGLESGVTAIAGGAGHTCALTSAGAVMCWGSNGQGSLGNGSQIDSLVPTAVPSLAADVVAITVGEAHTCAITGAGGAKCWGINNAGELGNNAIGRQLSPVDVFGLASGVAAISAGGSGTCALTNGGGLVCWGNGLQGQLGNNSNQFSGIPVGVSGLSGGVVSIDAGGFHNCAVSSDGSMRCWGGNIWGQIGNDSTTGSLVPTAVSGLDGEVAAISAGSRHTCAVLRNGSVKCWGDNSAGQLGDGTITRRLSAVAVTGLTGIDTVPEQFSFLSQAGVVIATTRTSAPITPTGYFDPSPIAVATGEYSIGCTASFTTSAGTIHPGQSVCVRHVASSSYSQGVTTTLTIGGIAATFTSTTAPAPAFSLSPASVNFGSSPVGTPSIGRTITLSNPGPHVANGLVLGAAGEFAVVSSTCLSTLAGGASCEVTLVFTPIALGGRANELLVISLNSEPLVVRVPLSGTGTPAIAPPANFALTVTKSGAGSGTVTSSLAGINCGAACTANFNSGVSVALTAAASSGSVFTGWSGGGCSGTGACNVTMDTAKSVTATFNLQQFALTMTKSGSGTGSVASTPAGIACGATCSANFNSGVSVALAAAPATGSFFAGWSGACTGTGACNVTMDAAKSVGAEFKLNTAIPRLANISTRMQVLTGNDVLIGGFIIGGTQPKTVVVRARGPSLIPFGITNALANPTMQLFSGQTVIATSDDWGTAANAAAITTSGFAPSSPLESAILATLSPGAYTAVVSGVGGTSGVGIIEVFEVDRPEVPLANISTRGQVLTGNDVMIGGFVIQGDTPQTVVVRARGPSLVPFGITNALMDPVLQLFNGATPIATNDDWQFQTVPADVAAIQASGFAPADAREAVIRITLPPGAYTAIVSGKNGGTGVGIIEAFAQ